ncbi:MAG: hypothetical protein GC192_23865 [Bacteroidetes bacterium]|nr:hypothetical protein [Bacteroidota bacterium]
MKRNWIYFSNTFEINTRKAYAKMLKIGNDHDSRLNGDTDDPDILALWNYLNPLLLVYRTLFSAWQSSLYHRISRTLILTDTFKLLGKPWIRDWELKVYNIFSEDSPQDKALFPKKRAPFQTASYEERIIAVKTLGQSMATYPELATVKADVDAKYDILVAVRDEQKQAMQMEGKHLDALEAQRIVLAKALYRNLGSLMVKFYEEPTQGERFFDLSLIRRSKTDSDSTMNYSGQLNADASTVVAISKKFELSIGASFVFANSDGGGELHCFFAASASATDSANKAIILPGETVEVTAGEMGWSDSDNLFIVRNVGTVTAEFELTGTEAIG